jgi:hypothetical protein
LPPVPGDTNADGDVDFADFVTLSAHFGQAGTRRGGDFDGNGLVDFADFVLLAENFSDNA